MARRGRRIRGVVLRVAVHRRGASAVGTVLLAPALVLYALDYPWEGWVTQGLGLVLGATGLALILAGWAGRRPDWISNEDRGQ